MTIKDTNIIFPGFASTFNSIFDASHFCEASKSMDYIILTHRKKYLSEESLDCIQDNFTLIKSFDNVGDSFLEIWKNNKK